MNPIEAVTYSNPYPFYADLLEARPFYYDADLNCWIASSADAVTAVLSSDFCRVRPITEPIPSNIINSQMGKLFSEWVRMNDSQAHLAMKDDMINLFHTFDIEKIILQSQESAQSLLKNNPFSLGDFIFRQPIYTMATILGISYQQTESVFEQTRNLVMALKPQGTAFQLEQGNYAAHYLFDLFLSRGLFGDSIGHISNMVALLFQTYEATAGLIGNAILRLNTDATLCEQILDDGNLILPFLQEMLRFDPPIQNTRRFMAENTDIGGQHLQANDMILVVLAAANRDAKLNPNPNVFELSRKNRHLFTFGLGKHACPAEYLATSIAQGAIAKLLKNNLIANQISMFEYMPSANARIPLFKN